MSSSWMGSAENGTEESTHQVRPIRPREPHTGRYLCTVPVPPHSEIRQVTFTLLRSFADKMHHARRTVRTTNKGQKRQRKPWMRQDSGDDGSIDKSDTAHRAPGQVSTKATLWKKSPDRHIPLQSQVPAGEEFTGHPTSSSIPDDWRLACGFEATVLSELLLCLAFLTQHKLHGMSKDFLVA
jgi:hypothetical protein